MPSAFISIGSNIDPERNIAGAIRLLAGQIRAISTIYRTKALGRPEQPDFYNGVIEIETDLAPDELREQLKQIEAGLGRVRTEDKYAPRTIDLDIIVYDGQLLDPDVETRPFLSIPLAELAPGLGWLSEIAERHITDDMQPLREFTEHIGKDLVDELRKNRTARP